MRIQPFEGIEYFGFGTYDERLIGFNCAFLRVKRRLQLHGEDFGIYGLSAVKVPFPVFQIMRTDAEFSLEQTI